MRDFNAEIDAYFKAHPEAVVATIVISAVLLVLSIIAMWKIFEKAGEKGWKAIIPIYDLYILFKICWNTKAFWIFLTATIVGSVCDCVAMQFPKDSAINITFTIVSAVCAVVCLVYAIMLDINISKSFGHGAGYAVGLIFLTTIFTLILGFGNSQYVGNAYEKQNKLPDAQA